MSDPEQTPMVGDGTFGTELKLRLVEAQASLQAAEALGDPLLAQIAASDLADLRSLAARNDVATDPARQAAE